MESGRYSILDSSLREYELKVLLIANRWLRWIESQLTAPWVLCLISGRSDRKREVLV